MVDREGTELPELGDVKICCILNDKSGSANGDLRFDFNALFAKHGAKVDVLTTREGESLSDLARTDVAQKNLEAWDYYTKNPKLKTHRVTDEEQRKEWDPIAREYQLKKFIELVGKEKADQLLKAIAASK